MSVLKPGVISGEKYHTLLKACKDGKYALPAVNVTGTNSLNAVLEAAAAGVLGGAEAPRHEQVVVVHGDAVTMESKA